LERNLIIERVRAGMRRARLEGRHIGRRPIEIDRVAVLRDRNRGDSLTDIAKTTGSPALRSAVCSNRRKMPNPYLYRGCSKGVPQGTPQLVESMLSKSAELTLHKVCLLDSTPASPKVAHL
jgi:hypothetical protein